MSTKAIMMLLLSYFLTTGSILCQVSYDFKDQDFSITIFPEEPGICPNQTADVSCIEEFDSYKWEMVNPVPDFTPLYGQSQTLSYTGKYKLTVEKSINNVLCSKEIEFEVHDLKNAAGIEKYLQKNGFYGVPIIIEQTGVKNEGNQNKLSCELDRIKFNSGFNFIDLNTDDIVSDLINNFKPYADNDFEGIEVKTKNSCFCDIGLENLEEDFYSNPLSVWVHEFTKNADDTDGTLYIKGQIPYEGDTPISDEHLNHLEEIQNLIFTNDQNNEDPAKATFEHLRVTISNVFMPNPTGGYNMEVQCQISSEEIENGQFLTPGQVAIFLPNDASNIYLDKNINSTSFGSVIKFNSGNRDWQNYHRNEDFQMSNGYFNPINAEFFEDFTTSITECDGCDIEVIQIAQECDNSTCSIEADLYSTEAFILEDVKEGGFNYEMSQCNSVWNLWPISKKASKTLIYDLLCAIKNGDSTFDYDDKFNNRVIFAKNIRLSGKTYQYVGVTMPKSGESIELLESPSLNNFGTTPGFINSFEISTDKTIRLNFFKFEDEDTESENTNESINCKAKLKAAYTYTKWETKAENINGCLQYYGISDKYEFLEYLNPPDKDNLLILVNGYRTLNGTPNYKWYKGVVEYPTKDPIDAINTCNENYKSGEYWGEISDKFASRVNKNMIYVDGHHSISTSNHLVMATDNILETSFLKSLLSCVPIKYTCFNALCTLNDVPNGPGFDIRRLNGLVAGMELWEKMVNGEIDIKLSDDNTQIEGKIDLVVHSFGYAYSKGMLDYLQMKLAPGNTFGNYYIIAPENPRAYSEEDFSNFSYDVQNKYIVNTSLFESVFQYGSDFTEGGDKKCKQDGVAAQSRVRGLDEVSNNNNVFIPDSENKIKSFIKAHQVKNYHWLFTIANNGDGYIKPRY